MRKIFIQSIIVVIVFASLMVTNGVSASGKGFRDVSLFFWAKPNIDYLVDLGAIEGFEDGTFGLGKNVTRAQASKIIVESLKLEIVTLDNQKFKDVHQHHWARKYIETLSSKGIIEGFEDGTFKPDDNLTRSQMAKILSNSFELEKLANTSFKDVSEGHWAYEYIMKLAESGMTTGYGDQTYRPDNAVTREEMAVFVSRGIAKRDGISLPEPIKKPANQTNIHPYNQTVNDPISQLPIGATFKEYDRSVHNYYYEKMLAGGGNISSVSVNALRGKNTVYIFGQDKSGEKFTGIYYPDELEMLYAYTLPDLTDEGYSIVSDLASEFAVAYGWQDVYIMIEMNIIYDGNVRYIGSNTNSKTLGIELDKINKFSDDKFIFKNVDGGRVFHSYEGLENNDEYKWIITSDSCDNGICSENVDSIIIDEEKQFRIEYMKQ